MHIFDAIILGAVEGITEFLPVSSTGHMILAGHILGLGDNAFVKSFEIIIQLGAILAVVFVYRDRLFKSRNALLKVFVAFLPTAIIGLALYSFVKKYLLGNDIVVTLSLLIGGIALIWFEKFVSTPAKLSANTSNTTAGEGGTVESKNVDLDTEFAEISYKKAAYVGVWQVLAMIPGVSRSAATIVGGELMGISRKTIVEFTFLLAIPTMLAASALDVYKHLDTFHASDFSVLAIGFVTAFVVALLAVKSFLAYIQKNSFASFGYYRIVVALLYAWLFLL